MKTRSLLTLLFVSTLLGCGGGGDGDPGPAPVSDPCLAPDNLTRVRGGTECLVIKTTIGTGTPTVLFVVVHGDVSAGGPAEYLYSFAAQYALPGVVSVALLRPGYYDAAGATSTGTNTNRMDSYTETNVAAVAGAVQQLKAHHRVTRVVYMGHSGGAAIGGVIAGKHVGTADAFLLVSCPCNVPLWRQSRTGAWPNSLSPHDYAANVPLTAQVIALTGAQDTNTAPHLGFDYALTLTQRGVNASFREIPGATHDFSPGISQSTVFDGAVRELLGR